MNAYIEWSALGQVLVAGVLIGAGIPALFALGLRLLAGAGPAPVRPSPVRLAGAILCLAIVIAAVAFGLFFVISGGH